MKATFLAVLMVFVLGSAAPHGHTHGNHEVPCSGPHSSDPGCEPDPGDPTVVVPVGAVTMWVTDTPPTGWLLCDGSLVSRADFANLFAVIGTTYGAGDGVTTFGLPDLRGRFPLGQDDMGGSPANRVGDAAAAQLAGSGGEELRDTRGDTISGDTTLTASQSGSGAHTHDVNASDGLTPGSSHKVALHRNVTNTSVISNAAIAGGGSGSGATEGHNHTISSGDANQDFMNPYQVLNFIIAH